MTIYFVRHGETDGNASRTLQFPHTPLSDRGHRQAARVAARLASVGAGAILASDFTRAAQTAEAIAAATGLPITGEPLLQERHFGELRGKRYADLDFDPMAEDYAPPGGEDWPMFDARVEKAFAAVMAMRDRMDKPLIVVSHGLALRRMLRNHLRRPDGVPVPEDLLNTSVTVCEAVEPYHTTLIGCALHLEGDAVDDGRGLSGF